MSRSWPEREGSWRREQARGLVAELHQMGAFVCENVLMALCFPNLIDLRKRVWEVTCFQAPPGGQGGVGEGKGSNLWSRLPEAPLQSHDGGGKADLEEGAPPSRPSCGPG